MKDTLAQIVIDKNVMHFGKLGTANKNDSRSVIFDPRLLLSDPQVLKYIGKKLASVVKHNCSGNVLVGLATAGIGLGAVASIYSNYPFLYLRSKPKLHLTYKWLEGAIPQNIKPKIIIVDELVFNASTKKKAIEKLTELGYEVTDVVVVIDRQLQKQEDGPSLEHKFGVKLHALITMEDLVDYMIRKKLISTDQLNNLIADYSEYNRWHLPKFAQLNGCG